MAVGFFTLFYEAKLNMHRHIEQKVMSFEEFWVM